jgi:hypothetical protein
MNALEHKETTFHRTGSSPGAGGLHLHRRCIEDASKMLFKLPSTGESPQTKQLITSGKHAYKIENFEL